MDDNGIINENINDYTEWQREHYDQMTPEEIFKELNDYSQNHTFEGKKAEIV